MNVRKPSLDNVFAKINRAKHHIADFEKLEKRFIEQEAYTIIVKEMKNRKHLPFHIWLKRTDAKPIKFSPVFGDAVHNLRASLDHLACQLVILNGKTDTCVGKIQFPIGDSRNNFNKIFSRQIGQASPEAQKIIKDLKPYKRAKGNRFWQLHQLDIIDKHRFFVVIDKLFLQRIQDIVISPKYEPPVQSPQDPVTVAWHMTALSTSTNHHIVISERGRLIGTSAVGELDYTFKPEGFIELREPGIFNRKPALPTLLQLVEFVEGVVRRFAPLFI